MPSVSPTRRVAPRAFALGLPTAGRGVVGGPLGPLATRTLAPDTIADLVARGRRNRDGRWPVAGGDLADARNNHATNRLGELRAALAGSYDWLEVDVRRIGGTLVASHDRIPARDAVLMRDWITVGAATERGLKLDFKERDAIAPTLDLVAAAGVPDARLVINVPVLGAHGLTVRRLRRIRARFPRATINLSVGSASWNASTARAVVALARATGGPVAIPVELSSVHPRLVAALRQGGRVAVWNDPDRSPAGDRDATRARLRAMGVDGTIDLR